jgi:hypothetical protein
VLRKSLTLVGGAICGVFVVAGVLSVVLFRPWRRWVEKRRIAAHRVVMEDNLECMIAKSEELEVLDGVQYTHPADPGANIHATK